MANTTFNGPVRSQNGFETVSINSTTGAVTVTSTLGPTTSVDSLAVTASASIGNAATDTVGFYGATAVVQPATTGTVTGFTAGVGTAAKDDSTYTGNTGSTAYTVGDIVKALKDLGLLAA